MALIPSGTRFEAIPVGTPINLRSALVNETDPSYTIEDLAAAIGGGGGLEGDSFLYVEANSGSELSNGAVLLSVVQQATFLEPYGSPLSATNRVTVLVPPGTYNLNTSPLTLTTPFVDVVSLTGKRDVIIKTSPFTLSAVIIGNNVKVVGIKTDKKITIESNANVEIENCQAGFDSFGAEGGGLFGTFKNCEALGRSFGYGNNTNIQATFIDCKSGSQSFGKGENIFIQNATFTNCISGGQSFGNGSNVSIEATAKFNNCTAGTGSFGYGVAAYVVGTFNNCIAGAASFGAGPNSGASVTCDGIFNNCTAAATSFGAGGTQALIYDNAILTNCTAGLDSFGGANGNITGVLIGCRLTTGNFFTVSGAGKTRLCLDGSYTINNQG
jgi:hypothetical protein